MHEASLVKALLRQVSQVAADHGVSCVDEIRVQIGPLAGVEPLLLQSAFERIAPQTVAAAARLLIQEVPLEGCCQACSREFEVLGFRFVCPGCQSGSVLVIRGDALVLESVAFSVNEPSEAMR